MDCPRIAAYVHMRSSQTLFVDARVEPLAEAGGYTQDCLHTYYTHYTATALSHDDGHSTKLLLNLKCQLDQVTPKLQPFLLALLRSTAAALGSPISTTFTNLLPLQRTLCLLCMECFIPQPHHI